MAPLRRVLPFLLLWCAAACHKKDDTVDNTSPTTATTDSSKSGSTLALPVVGEPVRKGDLILTVAATGSIHSNAVSVVKAETPGTILQVNVKPGDKVTRSEVIARIDPRPLDLDVKSAQATLDNAVFAYNTDVHSDSLVEGRIRPERRAYARAQHGLDGAQVALDKAKLAREHADIVAPFDGVVESVGVSVGDRVSGDDVATIVDLTHLRVEAQVLEHDIPLLRVGGQAIITVAAMPDKPVRGIISAILPLVDSTTRAGRAVIDITGDGTLRPGMYADVRLEATRLPGRIIVPTRAIVERDSRPLVFVAQHGIAEWVYINAGRSNGQETEILPDSASGLIPLKPGDIVLTDGQLTLTHQAPISLTTKVTGDGH